MHNHSTPSSRIVYPQYGIDFEDRAMDEIAESAVVLLADRGMEITYVPFRERLRGKAGYTLKGDCVCLDRALVRRHVDEYRTTRRVAYEKAAQAASAAAAKPWRVGCGGFSLDVIDMDTDEVRPATCRDLAELTRLADSYGLRGANVVQPQDVPPMLRDVAACRGSFENGEDFITSCHSHPAQTPYIVDMFKAVGKKYPLLIISVPPLRMAPESLEELLYVYDNRWSDVQAGHIQIEPMMYNIPGVCGPVTLAGCLGLAFTEHIGAHILLELFDERIQLRIAYGSIHPADLRSACYAFGTPRTHLFKYLYTRWGERLCGFRNPAYHAGSAVLGTSSCRVDEQAGLEKMASALTGALQGARIFSNAGNLCVDDLMSGVQLVIDMEIVAYIRELIESFEPAPDIVSMDGIRQAILDVAEGRDMFLSHATTAAMFRNIMPSSDLLQREKLRTWQAHQVSVKERARAVARERIRQHAFRRPPEQLRELQRIYAAAEAGLAS
jgi:trimethylamine:corrinoid methyltransferase-like protein